MFHGTAAGFAEQTARPRISLAEAATRRSKRRLSRDSQRSLTRCSKRARAQIAKGGGPIFSLRRSPAHYEGMGT